MNEVLEQLKELQDILAEKYSIESELKEIPRSLNTKIELVNRLKKSFIDRNAKFDETKHRINELRIKMQDAEKDRETYEAKIVDISTQREYEALVKEIRDSSEKEQNYRKDLQKEEKVLQEMEVSLEREEALIHEQEEELKTEQEKIEQELSLRGVKLQELENQEKIITPGMDEEIVFKFKRIIKSKQGKGIVPLAKGVCSGCNMILPLQFVNDVRSGKGIKFCPYCSMILFFQEEGEGEDILSAMTFEDTSHLFTDDDDMDDDFDTDDDFEDDELDDLPDDDEDEDDDDEDDDDEDETDDDDDLDDELDDEIEDDDDDMLEEEIEE